MSSSVQGPVTKSELVAAINTYTSARVSGDGNLVAFGTQLLNNCIATLEFAPEEIPHAQESTETSETED